MCKLPKPTPVLFVATFCAGLVCGASALAGPAGYTVTDLGPNAMTGAHRVDINDRSNGVCEVVGANYRTVMIDNEPQDLPFGVYVLVDGEGTASEPLPLASPDPDPGVTYAACAISDNSGKIVGWGHVPGQERPRGLYWDNAFAPPIVLLPLTIAGPYGPVEVWEDGAFTGWEKVTEVYRRCWAEGVNDAGVVVGASEEKERVWFKEAHDAPNGQPCTDADCDHIPWSEVPSWAAPYAVAWHVASGAVAGPLLLTDENSSVAPVPRGAATDINNSGLVSGELGQECSSWTVTPDNFTANVPVPRDRNLGKTNPGAGYVTTARSINDAGAMCGDGDDPFLWMGQDPDLSNSLLPRLGDAGTQFHYAYGLNNKETEPDVVGETRATKGKYYGEWVALLWRGGKVINLNNQISDRSWHLEQARAINANGQIVGLGRRDGQYRIFLLTPTASDPEPPPPNDSTLSINDVSKREGRTGKTTTFTFTVTRSGTALDPITIYYATQDDSAVGGSDYETASGPLDFAQDEATKTILVNVYGDLVTEPDETFFVNLLGADGNSLLDASGSPITGTGTIINDDR